MLIPALRHSDHFRSKNEDGVLSSAPSLILLAKAKYLRVFTGAIVSVQVKGVEKVISVFISLKVCFIKKESNTRKLEWFLIPFYSTFHWLFPQRVSFWINPPASLVRALYNTDTFPPR